jgi:hypothetical protein
LAAYPSPTTVTLVPTAALVGVAERDERTSNGVTRSKEPSLMTIGCGPPGELGMVKVHARLPSHPVVPAQTVVLVFQPTENDLSASKPFPIAFTTVPTVPLAKVVATDGTISNCAMTVKAPSVAFRP